MQNTILSRLEKLETVAKVDKRDPLADLTDAEIVEAMISALQKMDGCSYEEAGADPAIQAALAGYRAKQKVEAERKASHEPA